MTKKEIFNNSKAHKNHVITETLNIIDKVVLFSIANYFLRFSPEHKKIHNINDTFENDWYEYIEYGSTNPLTIFLQRNGFTRDTATYIKKHKNKYVVEMNNEIKLKMALKLSENYLVANEVNEIYYNLLSLFI